MRRIDRLAFQEEELFSERDDIFYNLIHGKSDFCCRRKADFIFLRIPQRSGIEFIAQRVCLVFFLQKEKQAMADVKVSGTGR